MSGGILSWTTGEAHVVDLSTGRDTRFTTGALRCFITGGAAPDWSPDGARIVRCSRLNGHAGIDLYVADLDGGHRRRLTAVAGGWILAVDLSDHAAWTAAP